MLFPIKYVQKNNLKELIANDFIKDDSNFTLEELEAFIFGKQFLAKNYNGRFIKTNQRLLSPKVKELYMRTLKFPSFRQYRTEMRDLYTMCLIGERWNQYKRIYELDKDFTGELIDTENVCIPLETFYNLPYKTFYVDLHNTNRFAPFIGFFVNISFENKETRLPSISILRVAKQESCEEEIMFSAYFLADDFLKFGMVKVQNGKIFIDVDKSRIADNTERDVNLLVASEGATTFHENVREFVIFAFQLIQYIGSDKPDIVSVSKKREAKDKQEDTNSKVSSKPTIDAVGFRYGESIRAYHKVYRNTNPSLTHIRSERSDTTHPRKSPVAHIRKAHWQLYWTGVGRTVPRVKWISPIFVGINTDVPVIQKVK